MYCTKCGQPIQPGDTFCGNCGAAVTGTPTPISISDEDAKKLAKAQTIEEGNNILIGCGIVLLTILAFFLWGVFVRW